MAILLNYRNESLATEEYFSDLAECIACIARGCLADPLIPGFRILVPRVVRTRPSDVGRRT